MPQPAGDGKAQSHRTPHGLRTRNDRPLLPWVSGGIGSRAIPPARAALYRVSLRARRRTSREGEMPGARRNRQLRCGRRLPPSRMQWEIRPLAGSIARHLMPGNSLAARPYVSRISPVARKARPLCSPGVESTASILGGVGCRAVLGRIWEGAYVGF